MGELEGVEAVGAALEVVFTWWSEVDVVEGEMNVGLDGFAVLEEFDSASVVLMHLVMRNEDGEGKFIQVTQNSARRSALVRNDASQTNQRLPSVSTGGSRSNQSTQVELT